MSEFVKRMPKDFDVLSGMQVVRMRSQSAPRHGQVVEWDKGAAIIQTWPKAAFCHPLRLAPEEFEELPGERGMRALALRIIVDSIEGAEPWVVDDVMRVFRDDEEFQLACLLAYRAEHVPEGHAMDGNVSDGWLQNMGFGCRYLRSLEAITRAARHSVLPWVYRLRFLATLEDPDAIVQVLRECAHPNRWLNVQGVLRHRRVRTMQAIGVVLRRGYGAQLTEAFRDAAEGQLHVMSNIGYLEMCGGELRGDVGYLEMASENNSELVRVWLEQRMAAVR